MKYLKADRPQPVQPGDTITVTLTLTINNDITEAAVFEGIWYDPDLKPQAAGA